jgi:phenylpropionate dioxygenase-like ring-hydroxylating dioxygenase large terminal subunit
MLLKDSSMENLVDTANGTISHAIFSHPDIYEQELEQVFTRMWLFVGHESQIPNPGDYVRSRMGEELVIVTRARDRKVHVLLNSCAHRGNMVCRYDKGNGLAFQCSFHGWTYGSDGVLINLPPGSEDLYAPDLRKEDWGLLAARVELFDGTIWANWDDSAPSLIEYFGGAETYMTPPLADAEGTAGATEVAGGIMKWRVGLNWKVPMPDNDNTHGWITHRSARDVASFGAGVAGPRRPNYHIWFPEGHTTDGKAPLGPGEEETEDRNEFGGFVPDDKVVRDYLRERWAKRQERLGKDLAGLNELPHIFPNMGAVGRMIRVLHPNGPAETEMWSYILVDKAAPPEVKTAAVRWHERRWGPSGMIQKDDMENWFLLTQHSKKHLTRHRLRQNAQLRMSEPSLHGPSKFGLPGMWHLTPTDENIRRFYERWANVMEARDWSEMRIENSAKEEQRYDDTTKRRRAHAEAGGRRLPLARSRHPRRKQVRRMARPPDRRRHLLDADQEQRPLPRDGSREHRGGLRNVVGHRRPADPGAAGQADPNPRPLGRGAVLPHLAHDHQRSGAWAERPQRDPRQMPLHFLPESPRGRREPVRWQAHRHPPPRRRWLEDLPPGGLSGRERPALQEHDQLLLALTHSSNDLEP